ncbi:MAG: hypothetical protein GYB67_18795, partial [Chloroflexi bacterium]|nr:hypothetical protein [Chloroflexota bacterium]
FIPQALALYDRGYTMILPDQYGQGFSGGGRGDFAVELFVQNVIDVAHWARDRYSGPLAMGGGSLGSAVTYLAAAGGAPVAALILHNLYDFGPHGDALNLSRFAPLRHVPGAQAVMRTMIGLGAQIAPRLRIPFRLLGDFSTMVDTPGFYDVWRTDPVPIKAVTLRYMRSLFNSPAAIPFEANRLPALVINPVRDQMTSPEVTWDNYQRLGGPKAYVALERGHWSVDEATAQLWADHADAFLQEHLKQDQRQLAAG